ncbi:TetR/AcrR family transcriptional regulator [Nocardia panacis]|uniref:TetR/AcrR family transcriptional regulator n=1 Tax=Nocardia panacis TaxID=2340916 RepID=A0A3A4KNK8_9NOCA|nr:TetR/AcrR family transcriptional regulator [Nocardia panacis]RJO75814.1 TetR/AcrR family transcriptional regulator [Nocardia panacis]
MPSPTAAELLWGQPERPKRGPKPALTVAGIVAEAITLADADGLANLSMQRLAERLGFTKMSLYRYVPGKAELIALMVDMGMGEPPDLAAAHADSTAEPWRGVLHRWAEAVFDTFVAHPWALEATLGIRPIGPNETAWAEVAVRALADTGLTGPEKLDTVALLSGHVRGLVQQVGAAGRDQMSERADGHLARLTSAAGESYPALAAALAEEAAAASGEGDALRFGIERILDGLGVLMARRR